MRAKLYAQCAAISLICILYTGCGPSSNDTSDTKIIGGENIPEHQNDARARATVAITTTAINHGETSSALSQGSSFCTGTLISDQVVLTAAHCLQAFDPDTQEKLDMHYDPEDFVIYTGLQVAEDGEWIRAKEVIPHPDWDVPATLSPTATQAPHDIGVVILEHPVSPAYRPAKLADPSLNLSAKTIHLAGYGISLARFAPDTGTLRQVDVDLGELEVERKRFSVSGFGNGACAGDSGGPAYVRVGEELQLIGATSTGIELFGICLGIMNYYTDARQYEDWILSVQEG